MIIEFSVVFSWFFYDTRRNDKDKKIKMVALDHCKSFFFLLSPSPLCCVVIISHFEIHYF